MTEHLGRGHYERRSAATDAKDGSRNGYSPLTVKTTAGPVTLSRPKLRGTTIERTFGETRRRVKVMGRLPGERSCLSLVWAVLDRSSRGWRGVEMTPKVVRELQLLRHEQLGPPPTRSGTPPLPRPRGSRFGSRHTDNPAPDRHPFTPCQPRSERSVHGCRRPRVEAVAGG